MNIQLLLTGNELMNGDIVDSNSAMIADLLGDQGLTITRKVTVGDDMALLIEEMERLSKSADALIMNGGLGPTVDDLTAEALSQLSGQPLVQNAQALAHLQYWADTRGLIMNAANLKQAMLPQGVDIIPNPMGTAVGFKLRYNDCDIYCTPGVPYELKNMLQETIVEQLKASATGIEGYLLDRYHTFGQGESNLQQWISNKLPDWPEEVELGFRASSPTLEVKVRTPISKPELHNQAKTALLDLMGDYVVAEGNDNLASNLVKLLATNGKRITTAESCTGGLISSMITSVAGSSAVFEAGYVTYSNAVKSDLLGVTEQSLEANGAVSEAVVREMATGALQRSGADYAVAVSGIAGPDGGSDEKPVGTVWIAWGDSARIDAVSLYYPYGRTRFQRMVAGAALDLVRRRIQNISSEPRYLKDRQARK